LFIDLDGDGFGNATASHASCTAFYPLTDCDDRNDTTLSNRPLGSFSHPGLVEILCDGLNNDCNAATPDSRAETCDQIDTDCNCGLYNDPDGGVFVPRRATGDANVTRFDNGIVNDTDDDGAYAFLAVFRTQCLAAGYMFDCNDTDTAFPSAEVCDGSTTTATCWWTRTFSSTRTAICGPISRSTRRCAATRYNTTADCAPFNADDQSGRRTRLASDALFCNNFDDDCNNQTGPGSLGGAGALDENSTLAILFDERRRRLSQSDRASARAAASAGVV
jgi:hypothetical protein